MPFQSLSALKLVQVAAGTTLATVYITPADTQVYVKDICICNTTTTSTTIKLYLVPKGRTAGTTGSNANALFYDQNIASHDTYHWSGVQILNAGDTIQVSAAATGIVVTISGAQAI